MKDKTNEEINKAMANLLINTLSCCRCQHVLFKDVTAKLIRYGAPFCSDECAERASDQTIIDGQEDLPDFCYDRNKIQKVIEGLDLDCLCEYIHCLSEVRGIPYDRWTSVVVGTILKSSAREMTLAYLLFKGVK